MPTITEIFEGFPGRARRGYLGWSSCYLIRTDDGASYLFDCAGPGDRGELRTRLQDNGVAPDELTAVVISHFHYDHAANWDLFSSAKFYIHERELDYIESGEAGGDLGLLRNQLQALKDSVNVNVVRGDQQPLGDLTLLHLPGHTPGSMGLQLGRSILCSDALKHRWDIERSEVSLPVWNPQTARKSIARLAESADTLYPGHDSPLKKQRDTWQATRTPTEMLSFANGASQAISL